MSALNQQLLTTITRQMPVNGIFRSNVKSWFDTRCRSVRQKKLEAYNRSNRSITNDAWNEYKIYIGESVMCCHLPEGCAKLPLTAKQQISITSDPWKWWFAIQTVVLGKRAIFPTGEPIKNADLLMKLLGSEICGKFNPTESKVGVIPILTKVASSSKKVNLLLSFGGNGDINPSVIFPLFL